MTEYDGKFSMQLQLPKRLVAVASRQLLNWMQVIKSSCTGGCIKLAEVYCSKHVVSVRAFNPGTVPYRRSVVIYDMLHY